MTLRPEPPIAVSVALLVLGLVCFAGSMLTMSALVPQGPFSFLWYAVPFAIGAGVLVAGFRRTYGALRVTFGAFLVPYALVLALLGVGLVLRFLRQ